MTRNGLWISQHAIDRYRERVADVPDEQIGDALGTPAIAAAAAFGATYVRLGTGQHVVLDGFDVLTVLPAETKPFYFDPKRDAAA